MTIARNKSNLPILGPSPPARKEEAQSGDPPVQYSDPVFDRAAALASLDGDSQLLREVAGIFLAYSPKYMKTIREAIASDDANGLERGAHALKGSAANLLARGLVEAAYRLEEMGRAGSLAGSEAALESLERELRKLRSALEDFEKASARP